MHFIITRWSSSPLPPLSFTKDYTSDIWGVILFIYLLLLFGERSAPNDPRDHTLHRSIASWVIKAFWMIVASSLVTSLNSSANVLLPEMMMVSGIFYLCTCEWKREREEQWNRRGGGGWLGIVVARGASPPPPPTIDGWSTHIPRYGFSRSSSFYLSSQQRLQSVCSSCIIIDTTSRPHPQPPPPHSLPPRFAALCASNTFDV